ncbi:hypothetical protein RUM44_006243 [Polyplax serrata]|uniref:Tumor suppressor candidate 2 n=1 Tax=Polyplax serrata TaxID=468196 RepID=A0ABR1AHK3_POLSC
MGATSSRLAKKISNSFRSSSNDNLNNVSNENALQKFSRHLVFARRGSMYKDEDGDLAHEFYVEVPPKQGRKATMKRVYDNLTPEGDVLYDIPRLHVDFPYIIANL